MNGLRYEQGTPEYSWKPALFAFSRMGVVPGKDYQIAYSGKHDTSALGVINGDYDAAVVADTVMQRMAARGVLKESEYKVLWTSPPFPTAGFVHAHNLEPGLVEKIKEEFASFRFEGTSVGRSSSPASASCPWPTPATGSRCWPCSRPTA